MGRTLGRGNLFIYTLATSALGEVAIGLSLTGPSMFIQDDARPVTAMLRHGEQMVADGEAGGMLALWSDSSAAVCLAIAAGAVARRQFHWRLVRNRLRWNFAGHCSGWLHDSCRKEFLPPHVLRGREGSRRFIGGSPGVGVEGRLAHATPTLTLPLSTWGGEKKNGSASMTQVWCGIPVYNNAGTIADVVRRCREQISDIVVVDDGSSDADLRQLLKPLGVTVVRHAANLGKGAALLTAFGYAAERGGQYMVTLDGDGQHFPEDIPRFLPRLSPDAILIWCAARSWERCRRRACLAGTFRISGSALNPAAPPAIPRAGLCLSAARILELRLNSRHYNLEVEVVTRAVWAGLRIESVPIRVRYMEPAQRVSSFRPFRDNLRISLMHTRLVLRQLAPIPHRLLGERHSMDYREGAKERSWRRGLV